MSPADAGHHIGQLLGGLLVRLALARQMLLELVTMPASGVVHRTLVRRLVRIGWRRILCVPVSVSFLVGILIVSHCDLLATGPGVVTTSQRQQRQCHQSPQPLVTEEFEHRTNGQSRRLKSLLSRFPLGSLPTAPLLRFVLHVAFRDLPKHGFQFAANSL
jgi:hypothetical protein